jgi:hypothetical protein
MRAFKRQLTFSFLLIVGHLLLLVACGSNSSPFGADILFRDEFVPGQTGNWVVEGDEAGRTIFLAEQMLIEVDAPQTIQFTTLNDPSFADFSLQVTITWLAGDLESSAGVLYRLQGPDQFYRFEITMNGSYIVERRNPDQTWTRLSDGWIESTAIRTGLNETNRLKVVAIGPSLRMYVNDQLLLQTTDSGLAAGKIALDAGTFGRPGLRVAFDNVVVSRP